MTNVDCWPMSLLLHCEMGKAGEREGVGVCFEVWGAEGVARGQGGLLLANH